MKNKKTSLNIRKIKKQAKGITLIALVVTIIVLLILAGIALNLTIGQNGIFSRAEKAANTWRNAETNEQLALGELGNWIGNYLGENGNGGSQGSGSDDEQTGTTEVDGVPIPDGFYYVGGKKDTGLVISDDPTDKNKYQDLTDIPKDGLNGNQFVWVPVEDTYNFITYCGYYDGDYDDGTFNDCSEPAPEGSRYEAEVSEYNSMKTSVETNNGFYVARFEASENGGKVESKPNVEPRRNIAWGNSMTDIGTDGAVYKSQNMYNDSEHAVTSTLIYGAQWDAIMNWLDPEYSTATAENPCTQNSIVVKSEYGNHSGNVADCGAFEDDKFKNIYDLCGNLGEWTMEADSSDHRVLRGGNFYGSGSNCPVSIRDVISPDNDGNNNLGFRTALYL